MPVPIDTSNEHVSHDRGKRCKEMQHKSTKPLPGNAHHANVSIATRKDTSKHNVEHQRKHKCYLLDKQLNCLVVGVTPPSFAVHMTCVSYMSRASVRGPASGHQSSQSVLLGYLNLVSG
jgi:hypothetical protein